MKKFMSFDDYPKGLAESLKRVNAVFEYDENTDTLTIISKNKERPPLNNREKIQLSTLIIIKNHAYKKVCFREERED